MKKTGLLIGMAAVLTMCFLIASPASAKAFTMRPLYLVLLQKSFQARTFIRPRFGNKQLASLLLTCCCSI